MTRSCTKKGGDAPKGASNHWPYHIDKRRRLPMPGAAARLADKFTQSAVVMPPSGGPEPQGSGLRDSARATALNPHSDRDPDASLR
jgi:hypothetical protein